MYTYIEEGKNVIILSKSVPCSLHLSPIYRTYNNHVAVIIDILSQGFLFAILYYMLYILSLCIHIPFTDTYTLLCMPYVLVLCIPIFIFLAWNVVVDFSFSLKFQFFLLIFLCQRDFPVLFEDEKSLYIIQRLSNNVQKNYEI